MAKVDAPKASSEQTRNVMRGNRKTNSRPELALRSELHRRGRRFRKNVYLRTKLRNANVDILFPRYRLAVFVDGCFWHGCPTHGTRPRSNVDYWSYKMSINAARDLAVSRALTEAGWDVLRIWEHEHPVTAADRIEAYLDTKSYKRQR